MSGILSGVMTAMALLAFLGVTVWAYSSKRKSDFEKAASEPLNDEEPTL